MDHFFAKYVFNGYDEGRLFFWGHVGHFFGPWEGLFWDLGRFVKKEGEVCQKGGGDLKKGFLAEHRLKKRIICTCMRCQCNSLRGGAGQFLSVKKKDFLQGTG